MFYETAQTIGPGWHRSYKPTHYEDMNWSPSSRKIRSPPGSPQSYRRISHPEDYGGDDKATSTKDDDDEFFGRHSPTFRRKIFKDVWEEPAGSNHRLHHFADRPRLFKRVFKPERLEREFDDFDRGIPTARHLDREFDSKFDDIPHVRSRFESDFDTRKRDLEEEFEKAAGRVHHIPIMVERKMDEMRSRFGRTSPPPPPPSSEKSNYTEEETEDWVGPDVHRLRKNFEPEDNYSSLHSRHRVPRVDLNNSRPRAFTSPIPAGWEPGSVQTLPTRKVSKNSQAYEEKRATTPKSVFRSYSETHEDIPKNQQQQHAAAFRSHSDGHCPKNTYVTKISVNIPPQETRQHSMPNGDIAEEPVTNQCESDGWNSHQSYQRNRSGNYSDPEKEFENVKLDDSKKENLNESKEKPYEDERHKNSLQQIAAVLQNVDDLLVHVEAYSGTGRDKQFRFLDEMLTRCMLRLDDVDTEGQEDVRSARKAAVRQVQSCIEKLESKADESERRKQPQKNDSEDLSKPENETPEEAKNEPVKEDSVSKDKESENPVSQKETDRTLGSPTPEQTKL